MGEKDTHGLGFMNACIKRGRVGNILPLRGSKNERLNKNCKTSFSPISTPPSPRQYSRRQTTEMVLCSLFCSVPDPMFVGRGAFRDRF